MKRKIDSKSDGARVVCNATRLVRLAAFAPVFRDPATVFGIRHSDTGTGTRGDRTILGWYQLSEVGAKFVEMAYDAGWVVRDFDWPRWAWSEEGQSLSSDRGALGTASCDQLAKLLTALIRQDRFCDGVLENAFEVGLVRTIAERAEALVATEEPK